ncbi:hypothetical protein RvY_16299 [Ramazzottius varieornatus]|uniref:MAM domain-containing protein n=1 Tax=Ramazzottius varieornatus TaxID=947166 RepID=A0A1D1VY05_RAMVA|nr:hypothetical protein RvY_16299 [Ramazzottius varieornatus]
MGSKMSYYFDAFIFFLMTTLIGHNCAVGGLANFTDENDFSSPLLTCRDPADTCFSDEDNNVLDFFLSCSFEDIDETITLPPSRRYLPVCGPVDATNNMWKNIPWYPYQFRYTDDRKEGNFAVKSNCTRLAIDKPTVGPEAIATLRTSVYQHGTPNYECRRFYVSFWVRFSDRPVFTENPEDELRFFLSLQLFRPRQTTNATLPQIKLWGKEASDFTGIEKNEWYSVSANFTENEPFSLVFFAHHKNNCTNPEHSGVIFVDEVITTTDCVPTTTPPPTTTPTTTTATTTTASTTLTMTKPPDENTTTPATTLKTTLETTSTSTLTPTTTIPGEVTSTDDVEESTSTSTGIETTTNVPTSTDSTSESTKTTTEETTLDPTVSATSTDTSTESTTETPEASSESTTTLETSTVLPTEESTSTSSTVTTTPDVATSSSTANTTTDETAETTNSTVVTDSTETSTIPTTNTPEPSSETTTPVDTTVSTIPPNETTTDPTTKPSTNVTISSTPLPIDTTTESPTSPSTTETISSTTNTTTTSALITTSPAIVSSTTTEEPNVTSATITTEKPGVGSSSTTTTLSTSPTTIDPITTTSPTTSAVSTTTRPLPTCPEDQVVDPVTFECRCPVSHYCTANTDGSSRCSEYATLVESTLCMDSFTFDPALQDKNSALYREYNASVVNATNVKLVNASIMGAEVIVVELRDGSVIAETLIRHRDGSVAGNSQIRDAINSTWDPITVGDVTSAVIPTEVRAYNRCLVEGRPLCALNTSRCEFYPDTGRSVCACLGGFVGNPNDPYRCRDACVVHPCGANVDRCVGKEKAPKQRECVCKKGYTHWSSKDACHDELLPLYISLGIVVPLLICWIAVLFYMARRKKRMGTATRMKSRGNTYADRISITELPDRYNDYAPNANVGRGSVVSDFSSDSDRTSSQNYTQETRLTKTFEQSHYAQGDLRVRARAPRSVPRLAVPDDFETTSVDTERQSYLDYDNS